MRQLEGCQIMEQTQLYCPTCGRLHVWRWGAILDSLNQWAYTGLMAPASYNEFLHAVWTVLCKRQIFPVPPHREPPRGLQCYGQPPFPSWMKQLVLGAFPSSPGLHKAGNVTGAWQWIFLYLYPRFLSWAASGVFFSITFLRQNWKWAEGGIVKLINFLCFPLLWTLIKFLTLFYIQILIYSCVLIVIVCAYVIENSLEPFSTMHSSGKKILERTPPIRQ